MCLGFSPRILRYIPAWWLHYSNSNPRLFFVYPGWSMLSGHVKDLWRTDCYLVVLLECTAYFRRHFILVTWLFLALVSGSCAVSKRTYFYSPFCLVLTSFQNQGPVSRKSRKRFGPEKAFLKLPPAYSKRLVFNYDFKIRTGKFVAKFHAWKRLRFFKIQRKLWHPKYARKVSGVSRNALHDTQGQNLYP